MKQMLYRTAVKRPHETIDRFWSYATGCTREECWIWHGGLFSNGYGQFRWGRRKVKAHRFIWQLLFGPIPQGKIICHTCDNPKCVNPNHLFLGTHKDNTQDMLKKGRAGDGGSKTKRETGISRGANNPAAKIKPDIVKKIRYWLRRGYNYTDVQDELKSQDKISLSKSQIANIKYRRSWSHVG